MTGGYILVEQPQNNNIDLLLLNDIYYLKCNDETLLPLYIFYIYFKDIFDTYSYFIENKDDKFLFYNVNKYNKYNNFVINKDLLHDFVLNFK